MNSLESSPVPRLFPRRTWSALALLLVLTGCRFTPPEGSTLEGEQISSLYRFFLYAAIVVGGITYALILWSALRYRKRSDELPKQTRYNIPVEVAYTLIPLLIVVMLFALTVRTEQRVTRLAADPDVRVNVSGFQWQWRFDYPDLGISVTGTPAREPTMVLPVGQNVRVTLTSEDVIHSFYVPRFLFKRDTIPGITNRFDLVIPRPGTFRGECAEFCGLRHAYMGFYVKGVSREDFRAWVGEQRVGTGSG